MKFLSKALSGCVDRHAVVRPEHENILRATLEIGTHVHVDVDRSQGFSPGTGKGGCDCRGDGFRLRHELVTVFQTPPATLSTAFPVVVPLALVLVPANLAAVAGLVAAAMVLLDLAWTRA